MLLPIVLLVSFLIGTAYCDPTDVLWPLPNNHSVGTDMFTIDPKKFSIGRTGAGANGETGEILVDAIHRYMKLIFLPPLMESVGLSKANSLSLDMLIITVYSDNASLQLDTDNSCMFNI